MGVEVDFDIEPEPTGPIFLCRFVSSRNCNTAAPAYDFFDMLSDPDGEVVKARRAS